MFFPILFIAVGSNSAYVSKGCIESEFCIPGFYSASALNGANFLSNLECCDSDLCNRRNISLPRLRNSIPNGLQCPACFTFSSDNCNPTDTVACLGLETQCFYFGATVTFAPVVEQLVDSVVSMAVRGCGTADICAYKPGNLEMDADLIHINITHAECQIARTNVLEATIPNDYP
ncbi:hypothetical protein JD844_005778 [Phrynosoma platyrhinos]|uniref:UPAR/Ly6 domain-containing protein n=1 Tax=Phrynosoma platyrhinos TaxID=52577 RepID=A0ABQ7TP17_PHRPL|nr:hypothetical protein JD844_005778 [Phrynosoma platyrhinos]